MSLTSNQPDTPLFFNYLNTTFDYISSRGNAYHDTEQYVRAIADYSKAIEIKPDYPDLYYFRGEAYSMGKKYSLAIADYSKVIEISPTSNRYYKVSYYKRAFAYYAKEQYSRAIADYSKAIEIYSDDMDDIIGRLHFLRAEAYRMDGQYSLAIADYSKAIENDPDNTDSYFSRGVLYYKTGKKNKSKLDLKRSCDLGRVEGCKLLKLSNSSTSH